MNISPKIWKIHSKSTNFLLTCILMKKLGLREILTLFLKRIFSFDHYYVMQRSLSLPIDIQRLRLQVDLQKVNDDEMCQVIEKIDHLDTDSKRELISRILFYRNGIKHCYIAKTKDDEIIYLQWLIYPTENDIIKKFYKGVFNPLKDNQVLIENVFTFPKFRGQGLIVHITAKLLEIARDDGYKGAIMYIRKDKIESLSQNMMLGFKITSLLREYKIFGITKRHPIQI